MTSQDRLRFALITDTKLVTPGQLFSLTQAMQDNMEHCWTDWVEYLPKTFQGGPPSVMLWDDGEGKAGDFRALPSWDDPHLGQMVPLYFVDGEGSPGALAVHSAGGRPWGRVYCDRSTGLHAGQWPIIKNAGHEGCEIIADAFANLWLPMPGRPGWFVAQENADPVQDSYYAMGSDDKKWPVANYVTPAWFGLGKGTRMDRRRTLSEPGQVGPYGYVILKSPSGAVSFKFGSNSTGLNRRQSAALMHPASRTAKRFREAV